MTPESPEDTYKAFTTYKSKEGRHIIKCAKGLWLVDAPTKEMAEREAWHYFIQYFSDGEYS